MFGKNGFSNSQDISKIKMKETLNQQFSGLIGRCAFLALINYVWWPWYPCLLGKCVECAANDTRYRLNRYPPCHPKRKFIFQPSICRCEHIRFREGNQVISHVFDNASLMGGDLACLLKGPHNFRLLQTTCGIFSHLKTLTFPACNKWSDRYSNVSVRIKKPTWREALIGGTPAQFEALVWLLYPLLNILFNFYSDCNMSPCNITWHEVEKRNTVLEIS